MQFIDPRIDFAFKKIFGSEDAKDVLIDFLENLLGLEGERRLASVTLLDPFLAPRLAELKSSILDVRCLDQRGVSYIVEMQVQKIPALLKRVQYNAAKTYAHQIPRGGNYRELQPVIAITLADFLLFPTFDHCVSCHESRETVTGQPHLLDILYYFIELPKFTKTLEELSDGLDQWIYFIKYAGSLQAIPPTLEASPIRHAFEKARVAAMSPEEWELYDKAGIAAADARGAVEEGEARGRREATAALLSLLLRQRFGPLSSEIETRVSQANLLQLEVWYSRALDAASLQDVFRDD